MYGVILLSMETPDVLGAAVNIAATIERCGHDKVVVSTETFHKLEADTRKRFRRHREPEVCLAK